MGRPRPGEHRGTGCRAGGSRRPGHRRRTRRSSATGTVSWSSGGSSSAPGGPRAEPVRPSARYRYLDVFEDVLFDAIRRAAGGASRPAAARAEPAARRPWLPGDRARRRRSSVPAAPGRCSRRSQADELHPRAGPAAIRVRRVAAGRAPARHTAGHLALTLTLDTFELVLRSRRR